MPELPEVETIRRALENLALDRVIAAYAIARPDYILHGAEHAANINEGIIESIDRRGKYLALRLSNQYTLLHHLGMSGRLILTASNSPLALHTHLRIPLDSGEEELRQIDPRRFGFASIFAEDELDAFPSWRDLGPDPFMVRAPQLAERLRGRTQPIKNALLNQRILAGIGNIYADEALFRSGIHPLRPAGQLKPDEIHKLLHTLRRVLRESLAAGGSSTSDFRKLDGSFGEYQQNHRVYGRGGEPCRQCGKIILMIVIGGRSSHFCERCQI